MNPGCDCVTMLPCPGVPTGLKPGWAKAGTAAGCVKGAPGTLKLCIPPGFQCDSLHLHSTISLRILSATWKPPSVGVHLSFYIPQRKQTSWRCMNIATNFTWEKHNWHPWGEFLSTWVCCWPRCPVRSLAIDQVEGPGKTVGKFGRTYISTWDFNTTWNWSPRTLK